MITNIKTTEEFRALIESNETVFVDFWAEWCGPCKYMGPILSAFAEANPSVTVAKVDVDENQELSEAYGIRSIPTIAVFQKDLTPVKTIIGAVPLSTLDSALKAL